MSNISQYPEKPISEVKRRPPIKRGLGLHRSINSNYHSNSVGGSPRPGMNRLPNVGSRGITPGRMKNAKSVLPPRPNKGNATMYPPSASQPRGGRFNNGRRIDNMTQYVPSNAYNNTITEMNETRHAPQSTTNVQDMQNPQFFLAPPQHQ